MPLKITNPAEQPAVLNKWADWIESRLQTHDKRILAVSNTAVAQGGSGSVTSVGLTAPKEFTVSGSPVTSSGTLGLAWAPENPGTVFETPPPGLSGYEGASTAGGNGGTNITVSLTPLTSTSFGLYAVDGNSTFANPSGWNVLNSRTFYKAISGTSPVSITQTVQSGSFVEAECLALFQGPAPAFVQSNNLNGTQQGTLAFSSSNTAGNTLVVFMQAHGGTAASVLMSDTNGNQYSQLVNQTFVGNVYSVQNNIFVAPNCVGGANTVNFNFGGGSQTSYFLTIIEFGSLAAGTNTPSFGFLTPSQIPPINLALSGNGGVGGILPLANGGTGANLSATGGANKVVQQTSIGAPFTVGVLTGANITNNVSAQSTSFSAAAATTYLCTTTGGSITVTFPAAFTNTGAIINVKKVSSDSNNVTITPSSGALIDGATTAVISVQYTSITAISDGTNWWII
jgi:hypothetical protein